MKTILSVFLALALAFATGGCHKPDEPETPPPPPEATSTPTVPPPPPKGLDPPQHKYDDGAPATFTVTAWNEKTYPLLAPAQYDHDLSKGWELARADFYLLSEWRKPLFERSRVYAAKNDPSLTFRGFHADTALAYRARAALVDHGTETAIYDGSYPGPPNPKRRYVLTRFSYFSYDLTTISLHFTSGCFPRNAEKRWYEARCAANRKQRRIIRALVAQEHAEGRTVVVGGDLNTNRKVRFGDRQADIKPVTLMQIAVVPAKDVTVEELGVEVTRARGRALFTDHHLPTAGFRIVRLADDDTD